MYIIQLMFVVESKFQFEHIGPFADKPTAEQYAKDKNLIEATLRGGVSISDVDFMPLNAPAKKIFAVWKHVKDENNATLVSLHFNVHEANNAADVEANDMSFRSIFGQFVEYNYKSERLHPLLAIYVNEIEVE